jgi:outer membrane protein assembly factor BamD (BamD/ComL family)
MMPFDRPTARRNRPSPRTRRRRALAVAALLGWLAPTVEAGPIADWIASRTAPSAMNSTGSDGVPDRSLITKWLGRDRTPFSSGVMGENSVFLGQKGWEKTKNAPDPASEAEFAAAKKLYDQGDDAGAEKLLVPLAKREVKKGSPWGEKAQYWLAEAQFRQKKYVKAEYNYELLIKKYPGTEYVDKLVAREYQIAQLWLSREDPKAKPLDWKSRFDGRQPLLDTNSYAVKALDHVRLHDPQGPLADDAALRTADHYHNVADYETAAVYYDQLLAEHPKSEYRERAQLSSIDSKMKAYIGPEYDITGLEQARDTIQKTMAEFPERQATADGLYHTLDLIRDQYAEREYTTGMYYVRARKPISAEYQFGLVMAKYPKSKWATQAKAEMAKIAKMPRKASLPSKIMTAPGAPDPSNMGGNGGNNGNLGGPLNGLTNGGLGGGGVGMGGSPY